MDILDRIVRADRAFVIAEIGVNYYDMASDLGLTPLDAAKRMIDEAHMAGADAVKFQTYKASTIVSRNSPAYWDQREEPTTTQYELFCKYDKFGEAEYQALAAHCATRGVIFVTTPFDFESADYLDTLMPFYKVSSSDLTNLPFIEHMARKGKPVFLSTGASTVAEIDRAVACVRATGYDALCLLHCVLDYPTDYEDANLNMIEHLGRIFPGVLLGFSDHTRPDEAMLVLTAAYLRGAKVIEKHFTLNKTLKGNDHYHAMDPQDLRRFVRNVALLGKIGGETEKRPLACEAAARKQARRSIVASRNIAMGEAISLDNVSFKRPGTGISPALFDIVAGRRVVREIPEDALVSWEDI